MKEDAPRRDAKLTAEDFEGMVGTDRPLINEMPGRRLMPEDLKRFESDAQKLLEQKPETINNDMKSETPKSPLKQADDTPSAWEQAMENQPGTEPEKPPEEHAISVDSLNDLDSARTALTKGEAGLVGGPVTIDTPAWPIDSLNDLDTARDAIARGEAILIDGENKKTEDEEYHEIFSNWGEEYRAKEETLAPEARIQMRNEVVLYEEAGVPASQSRALVAATERFVGNPQGFIGDFEAARRRLEDSGETDRRRTSRIDRKNATDAVIVEDGPEATQGAPDVIHLPDLTGENKEDPRGVLHLTEDMLVKDAEDPAITAWKKEVGEKLTAMYSGEKAPEAPVSPEVKEKMQRMFAGTTDFEKQGADRIPEKDRSFISRAFKGLDSLEKSYSKCPFWGKALISGGLIGAGIVGSVSGGWLGATVLGVGWAGARVASYLGAYGMMRALTKEQNKENQTLKGVQRGTALAYAILMPYLLNQIGAGEYMAKKWADWFGGTPTPSVPPSGPGLNAPVNPLDAPGPSLESMVPAPTEPPPVTSQDFMPKGGINGAFVEPSPDMARYFDGKITIKSGDTIWGLIQERLGANGSQADVLKRVEYLKSLHDADPAAFKRLTGIGEWHKGMQGFMIRPGDSIDLSALDKLGAPKGTSFFSMPNMPGAAAAAVGPTPEPIPAGMSYETVAINKNADIRTLFGPMGGIGENAFFTRGWMVPVDQYMRADVAMGGATGPIHGLSTEQVVGVKRYVAEMSAKYGIPQTGTLEQFMNKVAIAKAR